MKNALKDFLLWQKKRSELPVNDDPQVDWGQMESFLDEHMPVVKKTGGFKGFRTLPAILITFSAAAMIYVAGSVYTLEKHNHSIEHHFHKANPMRPGLHFTGSPNSVNTKTDTGHLLSGSKNGADSGSARAVTIGKNSASAKAISAVISKNAKVLTAANKPGRGLNGANRPSNLSSAAQQKANLVKNSVGNNKTGFSRIGSAHQNKGAVISGHGIANRSSTARENKPGSNSLNNHNPGQTAGAFNDFNSRTQSVPLAVTSQPALKVDLNLNKILPSTLPVLKSRLSQTLLQAGNQTKANKKDKPGKPQNSKPSNIDWGILIGLNTSGSFTPKSQNANFYGSASIDPWFGLFGSYKMNDNWAIAPQVHFFSPQNVVTTYSHANQSKVDSGQSLTITASRKMYAVSVPVYVVYNTGSGLRFKAGPVINFPVKQINTGSVLLPYSIRTDTSYYKNISAILNATQYQQSINFGFSAGASYQFKRFIFEATYLKSLSGYGISSGLGTYKSYSGTFQFTIGFQLDKVKP